MCPRLPQRFPRVQPRRQHADSALTPTLSHLRVAARGRGSRSASSPPTCPRGAKSRERECCGISGALIPSPAAKPWEREGPAQRRAASGRVRELHAAGQRGQRDVVCSASARVPYSERDAMAGVLPTSRGLVGRLAIGTTRPPSSRPPIRSRCRLQSSLSFRCPNGLILLGCARPAILPPPPRHDRTAAHLPHHLGLQPEGRRRQEHDRRQPRLRAQGRHRAGLHPRRRRPAGDRAGLGGQRRARHPGHLAGAARGAAGRSAPGARLGEADPSPRPAQPGGDHRPAARARLRAGGGRRHLRPDLRARQPQRHRPALDLPLRPLRAEGPRGP